jgi:hypothetical protein
MPAKMKLLRGIAVFALVFASAPKLFAQNSGTLGSSREAVSDEHASFFKLPRMTNLDDPYVPITGRGRVRWFISSSIGPSHLAAGLFSSAFGTALDRPKEYGPHWGGFADRYGMRMTGIVTGNAMEAGLGAIWGEDPRYFRVPYESPGNRVKNIIKQTFEARYANGDFHPAYARFVAVAGNNFLSNSWREPSESNTKDALIRTAEGIGGRMAGNAFQEFWPDIRKHVFHRGQ